MTQRKQYRGRQVQPKRSPLPLFYTAMVTLLLVGIGMLVWTVRTRATTAPPSNVSVAEAVRPLTAATGTTPDGFAYKGDPNAPVKVIEYADFQCPACSTVFQLLEPTIDQQYIETGKVQYIFHDFPLPMHANAIPAAEAARCAGDQGTFWPMHDLLFSLQREWEADRSPDNRFLAYADELALERGTFAQCLANDTYVTPLQQAAAQATQNNVQATPTFVVNGQIVAADQLEAAIEAALATGGRP